MKKKQILLDLFYTFLKVGLFTFGGGYAMISIIAYNCVEKKKWITQDEMLDVTVIAESTPGPLSINCATFIGYKQAGIIGSIIATLGLILPSFVIIFAISMFLDNFLEITIIANAFKGIKCAVGILIVNAALTMIKNMQKNFISLVILCCSFSTLLLINIFSWNFSSIRLILVIAILNLVFFTVKTKCCQQSKKSSC